MTSSRTKNETPAYRFCNVFVLHIHTHVTTFIFRNDILRIHASISLKKKKTSNAEKMEIKKKLFRQRMHALTSVVPSKIPRDVNIWQRKNQSLYSICCNRSKQQTKTEMKRSDTINSQYPLCSSSD